MEHYKHKYLCIYPNQEEYNSAKNDFIECNYSIINPPEETPDSYQPSIRETNNDNEYIMKYNSSDDLLKQFFLEIIWGYFGWEWTDYEYNGQTLKGGNLYKIKEIETVRSIDDGLRLYHINDFLNSQNMITKVESFDNSNIIAANRAFLRLENTKVYPTSQQHYWDYTPREFHLNVLNWPNLEEADFFLAGNSFYTDNQNEILKFPKITSIKGMFYGSKNFHPLIYAPNLTSFEQGFQMTTWDNNANINDIFVDEDSNSQLPKKLKNIKYLLYMAYLLLTNNEQCQIQLDLTSLKLEENDIIDASYLCSWIRNKYNGTNDLTPQGELLILLNFNHNINLSNAFRGICDIGTDGKLRDRTVSYINVNGEEASRVYYRGIPFETIEFKYVFDQDKLKYITDVSYGLADNNFKSLPLQQIPNDNCDDSNVYYNCVIEDLEYDFSPNKVLINGKGQFNNCTITDTINFKNAEYLKDIQFDEITLNTPCKFPCKIQNTELAYSNIENYTNYRTTLSMQYSDFTKVQDTDLYYYYIFSKLYSQVNPFYGCKNIDFIDTLNIHYSFENYIEKGFSNGGTVTWDFQKNTNMTTAPVLYFDYGNQSRYWRIFVYFRNLQKLTTVDLSNFTCTGFYEWDTQSLFFNNCTNLKYIYLKDFYKGIDFTGCYNLDINILTDAIKNAIGNRETAINQTLTFQSKIWNQFKEDFQNFCIKYYTINIIQDDEQESSES